MTLKDILIEKLIKEPLSFDEIDFKNLVDSDSGLGFNDLRSALKRVYNINESALHEASDATTGLMGIFNQRISKRRQKAYYKKINNGFVGKENHKVLVAEGDSWFQFIGKDIINSIEEEQYAIYTISYAGDWLANIIFEEKYIEELSIHKPSAFLVSGGGNDLVGGNRLAIMTCLHPHAFTPIKRASIQELQKAGCTPAQAEMILDAQHHILPEFYSFLLILKCQYYLIFRSLNRSSDLKNMAIITQGYDYAIPYAGTRNTLWYQSIVNSAIGSGKWLYQPLMIRGIKNSKLQQAIIMAMIFELNEMFINLAKRSEFPYLYHIDNRGQASEEDWFDELHLKPKAFERVAQKYKICLDQHFKHLKGTDGHLKNPRQVF